MEYSQQINDEENRNDRLARTFDGSPKTRQQLKDSDRRLGHLVILEKFDENVLAPAIEAGQAERDQELRQRFTPKAGELTLRQAIADAQERNT